MVKKFTVFFVAIFLCSCLFAYAQHAGNKDFSRKEAENSSFKGMDLSGAKFIHTDLDFPKQMDSCPKSSEANYCYRFRTTTENYPSSLKFRQLLLLNFR